MIRSVLRRAALAAACATALSLSAIAAEPFDVTLEATPITTFRVGGGGDEFGRLTFAGGFSLTADNRAFGQLSAFRFLTPGEDFLGVADHGYWFSGAIRRDDDLRPVGIDGFRMQEMAGSDGLPLADKHDADAEGLSVHDGIATVSFERRARVSEYRIDAGRIGGPIRDLDFLIPRDELRYNAGLETIARSADDGPLQGARVVVAERSIDADGNIFAAVIEGPREGIFKVRRTDEFDVTDGVFLPDGDLLLLERRFSYARGVAMRLRLVDVDDIRPGALVDGEALLTANMTYHVDNMEGIDVFRRQDGELVVALLSDDNQSWFQRTLYLEFTLDEAPPG